MIKTAAVMKCREFKRQASILWIYQSKNVRYHGYIHFLFAKYLKGLAAPKGNQAVPNYSPGFHKRLLFRNVYKRSNITCPSSEFSLQIFYLQIVYAGEALLHVPILVKLPHFVAITPVPLPQFIVPLIFKSYGDPVLTKTP